MFEKKIDLSLNTLKSYYVKALKKDYKIITCKDYIDHKKRGLTEKILINRVDVDWSCKKANFISALFNELGIKGTFFFRLHADEYNPFSFENYRIIKQMLTDGHEIGYHSEIVDQSVIWQEDAAECLIRDIKVFEEIFKTKISGIASHGGITGYNNLDFWKDKSPKDFGVLYEAYDKDPDFNLFDDSYYISDSNYQWKSYQNGKINSSNGKTFGDYVDENHPKIYLLIHPETYFNRHGYELNNY